MGSQTPKIYCHKTIDEHDLDELQMKLVAFAPSLRNSNSCASLAELSGLYFDDILRTKFAEYRRNIVHLALQKYQAGNLASQQNFRQQEKNVTQRSSIMCLLSY